MDEAASPVAVMGALGKGLQWQRPGSRVKSDGNGVVAMFWT